LSLKADRPSRSPRKNDSISAAISSARTPLSTCSR